MSNALEVEQVNAGLHVAFTVLHNLSTPEVTGAAQTLYSF